MPDGGSATTRGGSATTRAAQIQGATEDEPDESGELGSTRCGYVETGEFGFSSNVLIEDAMDLRWSPGSAARGWNPTKSSSARVALRSRT